MTWLLIVFGTALVLSPLMWLKQSPHQKRIAELRRQANVASLQVSLHRRPDAREDERRLEAVLLPIALAGYRLSAELGAAAGQ